MQRRKLDFLDYQSAMRDADHLLKSGYSKAGNWDLSLICEHLSIVMESSLDGFVFQWNWFWRRVFGPTVVPFIAWTRWMKQGLPAPHPSFLPKGGLTAEQAVQRFKRALERVQREDQFFPHPVLGKMSARRWRQIHLVHSAYHLSFLIPNENIQAGETACPVGTAVLQ